MAAQEHNDAHGHQVRPCESATPRRSCLLQKDVDQSVLVTNRIGNFGRISVGAHDAALSGPEIGTGTDKSNLAVELWPKVLELSKAGNSSVWNNSLDP